MLSQELTSRTKINIGSGHDYRDNYLNIDVDDQSKHDILIKDHDLSILPQRHYEEVLAHDVLEHIPHKFTTSALLDWAWLLKDGGKLVLQTSYVYGVIDTMRYDKTFVTEFNWMRCLFGNQAHPGDFHHNGFTKNTLAVYLVAAGFERPHFDIKDRWLIGCEARKVTDVRDLIPGMGSGWEFAQKAWKHVLRRELEEAHRSHFELECSTEEGKIQFFRRLITSDENLYKTAVEMGC